MRGNAVMRAKRTTGATPNTELGLRVSSEHCAQCETAPLVTRTLPDGTIERKCAAHIGGTPATHVRQVAGWRY